jgi:hypothetical protein
MPHVSGIQYEVLVVDYRTGHYLLNAGNEYINSSP